MLLRESEFLAAKDKLAPILDKRFSYLAKKANVKDDRKSFVEDLVALTMLEALVNSQKIIHAHISCEQLIRVKARNVWADYCKSRAESFDHANHALLEYKWDEEQFAEPSPEETPKTDWLLEKADKKSAEIIRKRLEGFSVKEIAHADGVTPGAITMQIQRLKKQIQSRL